MPQQYPKTEKFAGRNITFRELQPEDTEAAGDAIYRFANNLPMSDLMFLRMDITQRQVVDEWMEDVREGTTKTLLVEEDGHSIGYGNLHLSRNHWTRHMGQIRVLVEPEFRGLGVGDAVIEELIKIAEDTHLHRLVGYMPADQPKVRQLFEGHGFRTIAILTDWLVDREGRSHDLVLMARELTG